MCNVMALNGLTLVLEQRPEMEWKPGEMTHQKSPEHIVMAGVRPRVRPEEKGEPPCPPPVSPGWPCLLLESPVFLHPEAWLVCTPPSANSSGAPTEVKQLGLLPKALPGGLSLAAPAASYLQRGPFPGARLSGWVPL